MSRVSRPFLIALAFVLAAILRDLSWYFMEAITGMMFTLAVAATGVFAGVYASIYTIKTRTAPSALPLALVICAWLAWFYVPTRELAQSIAFKARLPSYLAAVAEVRESKTPECVESSACFVSKRAPGFIVFPNPGLLSGWTGIVYSPTGEIPADFAAKQDFAGTAYCNPRPIGTNFYVCNFG